VIETCQEAIESNAVDQICWIGQSEYGHSHDVTVNVLPVIFLPILLFFFTQSLLFNAFKALNCLLFADVPLRNYSLPPMTSQ